MDNNRLEELQQAYFNFCTELIKKIPQEVTDIDKLMSNAFAIRDDLEKEIIILEMNRKNDYLDKIKSDIESLKGRDAISEIDK